MRHRICIAVATLLLFAGPCATANADLAEPQFFLNQVQPLLTQYCAKCHGPDKKEGKFSLHTFGADVSAERDGYARILERLQAGDMPPDGEPRPNALSVKRIVAWIQDGLATEATVVVKSEMAVKANEGNRVPHGLLLNAKAPEVVPPPPRLWRMRPSAYRDGFVRAIRANEDNKLLNQPFDLIAEPGIKDYAQLYAVDSAGTEVLLRNAQLLVEDQTRHSIVVDGESGSDGRVSMHHDAVQQFKPLLDPTKPPATKELELALLTQFRLTLVREPTRDELGQLLALYEKNLKVAQHVPAAKTTLLSVLLMPEAVYRFELGRGREVRPGVRMLSPKEVAFAVSLALSDRREEGLFKAADDERLTERDEVAGHVRRILEDNSFPKPRLLGFFREYFGYTAAADVFKDKPDDHIFLPNVLVSDTDRLILWVLAQDKHVLKELLTTKKSFVNYAETKDNGKLISRPAEKPHPPNDGARKGPELVYGFAEWPAVQPVDLPGDRMGILMQPSWLVAWSGNFENDPIRRGRWIRERLLGGLVPDLPIGIAAKVPDEPHEPLRHRFRVTRAATCWKCHQKMDDLGLAFEGFSHYGLARSKETLLDKEASEKNIDPKGKPLAPVKKQVPIDSSGLIAASGEPALDGKVADAADMLRRLAESERVRQVFIRHVFRYYLGRNETAGDAKTLQEADKAYVESGGSFQSLLVSLLSSESFLYRSIPAAP
jgi:hypothetical protein